MVISVSAPMEAQLMVCDLKPFPTLPFTIWLAQSPLGKPRYFYQT